MAWLIVGVDLVILGALGVVTVAVCVRAGLGIAADRLARRAAREPDDDKRLALVDLVDWLDGGAGKSR